MRYALLITVSPPAWFAATAYQTAPLPANCQSSSNTHGSWTSTWAIGYMAVGTLPRRTTNVSTRSVSSGPS